MRYQKLLMSVLALSSVPACSAPREEVLYERHVPGLFTRHTAEIGVIATSASHRTIMFRVNGNPKGSFCAEPPPDVAEAIASQLALSAKGALENTSSEPTASQKSSAELVYARALATSILALTRRSQGLQWARDQNFVLCVDRLTEKIGPEDYLRYKEYILTTSAALIEKEIDKLPQLSLTPLQAPPQLQPPPPQQPRPTEKPQDDPAKK
ncbi:hypothetical protein [Caenispirillum bisanense]|uniref:hypothetical protein n=1 Tax=Caenispirillum bisanense TaxID=414052 RepID=UPI0031DE1A29